MHPPTPETTRFPMVQFPDGVTFAIFNPDEDARRLCVYQPGALACMGGQCQAGYYDMTEHMGAVQIVPRDMFPRLLRYGVAILWLEFGIVPEGVEVVGDEGRHE